MEKLRTLKDIKPYMQGTTLAEFDLLKDKIKQEAIKWIKAFQSDERLGYPTATIDINAPLALIQLELETKIKIFRIFFNITEEDLKWK